MRTAISTLFLASLAAAQSEQEKSIEIYRKPPKVYKVARWGPEKLPSPSYAFKANKLLCGNKAPIDNAVIVTRDSKILAVGKATDVEIPDDAHNTVASATTNTSWACP